MKHDNRKKTKSESMDESLDEATIRPEESDAASAEAGEARLGRDRAPRSPQ